MLFCQIPMLQHGQKQETGRVHCNVPAQESFEGRKTALLRRFDNFERQTSVGICSYRRAQLLEDPYHDIDELRRATERRLTTLIFSFSPTTTTL